REPAADLGCAGRERDSRRGRRDRRAALTASAAPPSRSRTVVRLFLLVALESVPNCLLLEWRAP
ncbi:hypothetical protein, partial [Burkholderia contaminans]|uniref:hypothetical protein n=1 Tax=Burkholderia contaminans TaxID=488447 RepID=UPI001C943D5F